MSAEKGKRDGKKKNAKTHFLAKGIYSSAVRPLNIISEGKVYKNMCRKVQNMKKIINC